VVLTLRAFGDNPHAKFRFSTEDFETVNAVLERAIATHSLKLMEEHGKTYPHEYDIIGDLAPASSQSHYGVNQRHSDRRQRGELLYSFLSSAAILTLHCLSHSDAEGRWHRESNPDHGNNHFGDTTESLHHLYCNLSNVSTAVCIVPVAGQVGPPYQLMSPLHAKISNKYAPGTRVVLVNY